VRGARLVCVYKVTARDPRHQAGHAEVVVLAWAQLGDGEWGVLIAWGGGWQQSGRTMVRARFAWCRLLTDRVRPVDPPRTAIPDAEWHGWHTLSEFAEAVRLAAASLPVDVRTVVLIPAR